MTATQMETITACEPQRILVIDDDFAVRLSLQILLRKQGYEVWIIWQNDVNQQR